MRDLKRNQKKIYYALYGSCDIEDEFENTIKGYSEPKKLRINVSTGTSDSTENPYGKDIIYDKEMITHDMKCPLDEFSKLWVDKDVDSDSDYKIVGICKGLNVIQYAIKKNKGQT